jgi:hypothetical protein
MWIDLGRVGFRIRHVWFFFIWPCGVLRASGACGSALGYHGRPLRFPWSVPVPETCFSVELGLCPCSLRMRLEGLVGGSCLSPPWRAAGSVQSPASLPHIHQVEGICQVRFLYQGRYSPGTRPVTLADDSDDAGVDGAKTGCLLIGAVQDQVQFGCFVLRLGDSRASFGLLSGEGLSSGAPRVSLWPPLGGWVPSAPIGGRGRSPLFPFLT